MNKRERNLGIELLRIICMMCMIIQHVIGHGWVLQSIYPGSWKYEIVESLRVLCIFGISCFALISGYVGVHARYKYSSLVLQWSKMWLYSVLFTVLAAVLVPDSVSRKDWIQAFFPTLHTVYWYFSAYVSCYLIAPMIRIAMRRMTFKQASINTAIMFVVFTTLSISFNHDAFYNGGGKTAMWLVVMYAIGAYFGWFKPHEKASTKLLVCCVTVSALLLVGTKPVAQRLGITWLTGEVWGSTMRSLTMAISMLLLFSRLEIRHGRKLISWLGAASFGVYVLHEHPVIRGYTISRHCYLLADLGNVEIVIGIVLVSAVIYLACALVDALREKIYRALRLRQRLEALESRLLGDLWAD